MRMRMRMRACACSCMRAHKKPHPERPLAGRFEGARRSPGHRGSEACFGSANKMSLCACFSPCYSNGEVYEYCPQPSMARPSEPRQRDEGQPGLLCLPSRPIIEVSHLRIEYAPELSTTHEPVACFRTPTQPHRSYRTCCQGSLPEPVGLLQFVFRGSRAMGRMQPGEATNHKEYSLCTELN